MCTTDTTVLIVIDLQEKLVHAMHNGAFVIENLQKLIEGTGILGIPLIATEQINLGPTISDIADHFRGITPIQKRSFSCCGEAAFMQALQRDNRRQALIAGIECHICVYQTAVDLVRLGYEVQVVADCVSSRTEMNRAIGLARMQSEGVRISSTEMALFELLKVAQGEGIRQISRLVK